MLYPVELEVRGVLLLTDPFYFLGHLKQVGKTGRLN